MVSGLDYGDHGMVEVINTYNSEIPEGMFCGRSLEIRSAFV